MLAASVCLLVYAALAEYLLHRFAMHKPLLGRNAWYCEHAVEHHGKGRNDVNIFLSPITAFVVGSPLLLLGCALGWTVVPALVAGCLIYSGAWNALHAAHHGVGSLWCRRVPGYALWRDHHMAHHAHPGANFGTVFIFTDRLFGTLISRGRIAGAILFLLIFGAASARAEVIGKWAAPEDDCEAAIVEQFGKAKRSIHYQMYNFTSAAVADALIAAQGRGLEVTLLLDWKASRSLHCQAARCARAGCTVKTDRKHPIAHNKVRLIDGRLAMAGSYNDSAQAHRNAENLYLENDRAVVAWFEAHFQEHLAHAEPYKGTRATRRAR